MKLLLKNISLPLAEFTLQMDLELAGGLTVLFGASGSGKTSLLDLIAGLRRPATAFIQLDDQVLTDVSRRIFLPPQQRGIGYVPQDLALFPHLSVRQNLLYGCKTPAAANSPFSLGRVTELLQLQPLAQRNVRDLSGGEKQRVALGRALLASPRLLLLDEPLASLDADLKRRLLPFFTRIRDEFKIPMLYVTHDRFETVALADQMIVLARGQVVQAGTVPEVFRHPASVAIADLLTVETIQPGNIISRTETLVKVQVGRATLTAVAEHLPVSADKVHVCIRAEEVIVLRGGDAQTSARNQLAATVQILKPEGSLVRVELDCGFPLTVLLTRNACDELALKTGDAIHALIKAPNIHLIAR